VAVEVDGVAPDKLELGPGGEVLAMPAEVAIGAIPEHASDAASEPAADRVLLWLEAGASQTEPVVPTPEEIEMLKALGYAK
jgi:hypothetical protein